MSLIFMNNYTCSITKIELNVYVIFSHDIDLLNKMFKVNNIYRDIY